MNVEMVWIDCLACQQPFEAQKASLGEVSIVGQSNVFKMRYARSLPCPHCQRDLDLEIRGHRVAGLPKVAQASERTECAIRDPFEQTQRTPLPTKGPTVRVKIGEIRESAASGQAQTTVKPFKILAESQPQRISMYRAKVSPKSPARIDLKKWYPAMGIGLGLALTLFLMLSSSWSSKAASAPNAQAPSQDALEDELSEGGPPEDVVLNEETQSTKDPLEKLRHAPELLELPSIKTLTSGFGIRLDPFSHRLAFHGGVDFRANIGARVVASLDGKVVFAGRKGKYGNLIRIQHPNGYETRYAHLSNIKVQKGQHIKKGQLIGLVGSTGRSTGPHLHFELLKNGKKVDPLMAKIVLPTEPANSHED